jgi:hypothetical protein
MARAFLAKNTNLLLLFFLLLVVGVSVMGYTSSLRHKRNEGFITGVKACDRDNDCPDGYDCNSQTCVKTKEYNSEGFDQYSTEKLNGMPCGGDDECRSGTCLSGKCTPRGDKF